VLDWGRLDLAPATNTMAIAKIGKGFIFSPNYLVMRCISGNKVVSESYLSDLRRFTQGQQVRNLVKDNSDCWLQRSNSSAPPLQRDCDSYN
jgi:hypothetical protein